MQGAPSSEAQLAYLGTAVNTKTQATALDGIDYDPGAAGVDITSEAQRLWLVKVIVLKLGGIALYRRPRPFFLGMAIGMFTTSGVWLIIDHFTGRRGSFFTLG